MEDAKLKEMLKPSLVAIKDGEGVADRPSGQCPGVIFLGPCRSIIGEKDAKGDMKGKFVISKPSKESQAMRYLQPMPEEERRRLGYRIGASAPSGICEELKGRFPELRQAEKRTGQPLQALFTPSKLGVHATQPAVVGHWNVHPVEEGVWAVTTDLNPDEVDV